ncbi:MAG TPA: AI-2E family transporter [Xanthobacteraceae bacterium]|nr:AI-2E family transporter [Xanthobacteraceae bacterium]
MAVILVFLFFIRGILLPFVFAAALALILTPPVDALHRSTGMRRWIAAVLVYLGVLAIFALLAYWLAGPVIEDLADVIQQLPRLLRRLIGELLSVFSGLIRQPIDPDALTKEIMSALSNVFGGAEAMKLAGYGIAAIFGMILMFVLLIYFLISGRRVAAGVLWLVPPEYRTGVARITAKIQPMLWRYFVGLIVVISYTSSVAAIGFVLVFHIPHAPVLSVAVGFLELIPVVGPAVSMGLVCLIAIRQVGVLAVAGLAGFAIALRLSIDQIVGPLVLGRAAQLHPVVIIFSFLSGAVLFGIIGLLLAVPVAASIKIVLGVYYAEPVGGQAPSRAGPESETAATDEGSPRSDPDALKRADMASE